MRNNIVKKRDCTGRNQPCGKRVAEASSLAGAGRPEFWAAHGQGDTFLALEFAIGTTHELNQAKIVWALLIATFPAGLVVEWPPSCISDVSINN